MSTPDTGEPTFRRIDRVLAYMALGLTVLSIAAFFVGILARPLGVTDFSGPFWAAVFILPLIALPIAFLLIFVLLIMTFVRRGRAGRA